jgi:hypothetical protein
LRLHEKILYWLEGNNKTILNMEFSLKAESLRPLWTQLYRNIGFSMHYQRYVIVEPLCYLIDNNSYIQCVSVDQIVYPQVEFLGKNIATYIDKEWGDSIEQVLVFNKKHNLIIVTDEELLFQKQRLPELLSYLSKDRQLAQKILGLVHYHVDEPQLSVGDIEAHDYFTSQMKLKGGKDQVGVIVSDNKPNNSLNSIALGEENFTNHMAIRLNQGFISIIGQIFTGKNKESFPVEVKLAL